jgi:dTDP-4-amino-4,6-dideoxygalactose transaminase
MMLRHVAPAGSPIRPRDLASWLRTWGTTTDPRLDLAAAIAARAGVPHAALVSTGRAGLTVLCRALRRVGRPAADEVIVPAYTCYSVPASIVRAGLKPRLVDVDPVTLDYEAEALAAADASRVLAIVATNLYGHPSDLAALRAWATPRGVLVVDDAAQALGAATADGAAGARGDAGLFSLDKGKNVSAIDGGVLVTGRDDVAAAIQAESRTLAPPPASTRAGHVVKALIYAGLLHPRLYWIPNNVPGLGLGRTEYRTDFVIDQADPVLAALGLVMLRRLDAFARHRTAVAEALRAGLAGAVGVTLPRVTAGATSAWLRFPMLVEDPARREALRASLLERGIGASLSYPRSLADVPELAGRLAGDLAAIRGGRQVAAQIITVPTHSYVAARDVATIVETIAGAGALGSLGGALDALAGRPS